DHCDRRRSRRETPRPQPERETARARDCASGARQGAAEPGAAQAGLRQTAQLDQSGGWPSETVRSGDRRWPQTGGDVVAQLALEGLRQQLDEMAPRVKKAMQETRARIFG